jgi:hypothetical protein
MDFVPTVPQAARGEREVPLRAALFIEAFMA